MGCSKCGGDGCQECRREVITKKGEQGDRGAQGPAGDDGADGADGMSEVQWIEEASAFATNDTSSYQMVHPDILYLDIADGDWIIEFSALLRSPSSTNNAELGYQLFEDADLSHVTTDSGDSAFPISERKELIRDPDTGEKHSLYTTAKISGADNTRIKVYYVNDNGSNESQYEFVNNILRAWKIQNLVEQ